jgi:hypothetical protein
MTRTVHVRIVPRNALVLDVRRRNGDPTRLLLRRIVDLIVGLELTPELLRHHQGHRRRQGRLPMIHVTDGPDVHMGLGPLEFALGHR